MPRFSIRRKPRVGPPKPEPAEPVEPKDEEKFEEEPVFDYNNEPDGFAEAFAAHAALIETKEAEGGQAPSSSPIVTQVQAREQAPHHYKHYPAPQQRPTMAQRQMEPAF